MEQDSVNQRLNLIVDTFERGVKAAFARKAGISAQGVQELLAGRKGDPSFKVLVRILENYPTVDANWLVLGRGNMLREEISSNSSAQVMMPQTKDIIALVRQAVVEQTEKFQANQQVFAAQLNEQILRERVEDISGLENEAAICRRGESKKDAVRLAEIQRAVELLKTSQVKEGEIVEAFNYTINGVVDSTKPFGGSLAKRLGITESEAREVVTSGHISSLHIEGQGYTITEKAVRRYLEKKASA